MSSVTKASSYIYNTFIFFFHIIYEKFFHDKASPEVIKFVNNLLYVGAGSFFGLLFSFLFNVVGGRFLGPSKYGEFTLIRTISMFLYVPMLMGISTAMVKYNSEKIELKRQKNIISASYIIVFISTIIAVTLYILLSPYLIELFTISSNIYSYAIILSIVFSLYTLTTDTLRSLHKMKMFGLLKVVCNFILLNSFLIIIHFGLVSSKSMLFSLYFAYIITGVIILLYLSTYFHLKFDLCWVKILLNYSWFTFLSAFSYILYTNIDKLFINKFMSLDAVGTYNAYYFSSIELIASLSGIFIAVYFPMSSLHNKNIILNRINKLIPYIILMGIPFTLLAEYITLRLYGDKYFTHFPLMLLFAITSILIICYDLYSWLFNSDGKNGAKVTLISIIAIAISNIVLDILTIPIVGLYGAIGSTLVAYLIGIYLLYAQRKKIFKDYY